MPLRSHPGISRANTKGTGAPETRKLQTPASPPFHSPPRPQNWEGFQMPRIGQAELAQLSPLIEEAPLPSAHINLQISGSLGNLNSWVPPPLIRQATAEGT